jgi:hypothetical protein
MIKIPVRLVLMIIYICQLDIVAAQQRNVHPAVASLHFMFEKFIKAEISHNWQEHYRMLSQQYKSSMTKKEYVHFRNRGLEKGYNLVGFKLLSIKEVAPERLPGKWWLIEVCGSFKYGITLEHLIADTEAVWEEQDWRFSQISIRGGLDGPPWKCIDEANKPQLSSGKK